MKNDRTIDGVRGRLTEIENDLVDELVSGRIGRREFLRHGSVLGLSLPLLGSIAGALGLPQLSRPARAASPGGTIRVAVQMPAGAIEPVTVDDQGGLMMLHQTGEFLSISGPDLKLKPHLAESWKPNEDGTVWTFKIRQGVKFHNGKAITAADVVASVERLANPKNSSNALSVFKGTLSLGNTKKVDDYTVEFHLDAPNGNFPYLVSSDNYNLIITPADMPAISRRTSSEPVPSSSRNSHRRSVPPSCETTTIGVRRHCPTARSGASTTASRRWRSRSRVTRSTSSRRCQQSEARAC